VSHVARFSLQFAPARASLLQHAPSNIIALKTAITLL
jgi:hypothetical protein